MSDAEQQIRALSQAGELRGAAEAALAVYGHELLGYLVAVLRSHDEAREVFARTCERAWTHLGTFRWDASLRTWLYTIAKHETLRYNQQRARERARRAGTTDAVRLAMPIRTDTRPWLRTDNKAALCALREALPQPDRELLVLRVDRGLAWLDIARVFTLGRGSNEALQKEAARLRKRYQVVREQLRRTALERGLLAADPGR